jgi:hypothetical protein
LGGSGRKGLSGAGGSMAAQTVRRGATVVVQRSSQGHRQGGRGSSRRRCGARCSVGWFGGGQGGGSQRLNDSKHGGAVAATGGGGCSFYSHQRRLAYGGASCGWGRQSGGVTRGGRAAKAAVGMASARAAPLFGPGG